MIFINTRPKNRSQILTDAMQAKGLHVLTLPLLDLTPIKISIREQQYQQIFIGINAKEMPYNALVVVSPTAARLGLSACPEGFRPNCSIIAVGDKTAEVLRNVGWQVNCPDEASNEGMMRMSVLSSLKEGDKVLIWRGRGGRRLLVNRLQDKGVVVDAIAWYQRHCPDDAKDVFKVLENQLIQLSKTSNYSSNFIVLVSSGEAFTNWRLLLSDSISYDLNDFAYLTFGNRLTKTLENLHLQCIRIDSLNPEEVWRGVELLQNEL